MSRGVVGKFLLALFSCSVSLLLAEAYLRNFYPCPYSDRIFIRPLRFFFEHDHQLGWRGRANAVGPFVNKDFHVTVRHDEHGHRSLAPVQVEGKKNVLVLGDSFGWGWGVENEEIFAEVMMAKDASLNVYNLSVPGYGTGQQYLLLERFLNEHPDYPLEGVILLVYSNDFSDVAGGTRHTPPKPRFVFDANRAVRLTGVPVPPPTASDVFTPPPGWAPTARTEDWRHQFHLYNLAASLGSKRKPPPEKDAPLTPPVAKSVALMKYFHAEIKRIADSREAFFQVVLLMPGEDRRWVKLKNNMDALGVDHFSFHRRVFPRHTELWHDQHLSAYGHRLLADQILDRIEARHCSDCSKH